ncbi:MAG TPA: MEDS domain-containing protein [Bacteroidia bacterium]|nr:MEDS domain-containing protein [Bacteroidia bacterium]
MKKQVLVTDNNWQVSNTRTFWTQLEPRQHLVQIYENDHVFLETLGNFVTNSIDAGSCVILIASTSHLVSLDDHLISKGYDVDTLRFWDQYIPIKAEECLASFMVDGMPDEKLFREKVTALIKRARVNGRNVRAFGEMVALLWAEGNKEATMKVEALWNSYLSDESFSLFCAYPRDIFEDSSSVCIHDICESHTKVIDGWRRPSDKLYYKGN